MLKDILIIANFCGSLDGSLNNRFVYISEMMAAYAQVELITSTFYHSEKKHRIPSSKYISKISVVDEIGYKSNMSLKRVFSHLIFSARLINILRNRKKPDVIYCAVPTLSSAWVTALYAKKNKIRFIIDIQDLWPESFALFSSKNLLAKISFNLLKVVANSIYKSADDIVAVSATFLNRAKTINFNYNIGLTVFIGTDQKLFDKHCVKNTENRKSENEIWVTYIGSLAESYDLVTVIKAFKILKKKHLNNITLLIIGDGPKKKELIKLVEMTGIQADFLQRMNYNKMLTYLASSDIAINPITKGSVASIINKHGDYAMAGLPIINTQECSEFRELLDEYFCGINCKCGDPIEVANAIELLATNEFLRLEMGQGSRRLAEVKFNRQNTYEKIMNLLLLN
jgi:glycosyltransferase involved in cell wall biosynthesis